MKKVISDSRVFRSCGIDSDIGISDIHGVLDSLFHQLFMTVRGDLMRLND